MDPSSVALAGGLASLALLLGAALVVLRGLRRRRVELRLREALPAAPEAAEEAPGALRDAGRALRSRALLSAADARDLERAALAAGWPARRALAAFLAGKAALMLLLPLAAYGASRWLGFGNPVLLAVLALPVGMLLPNWLLDRLRRAHLRQMQRGLAEALDLMVVCSEAGLGLETTVDRVAREMARGNPAVAGEFATLAHELRMLPDRRLALTRLGERAVNEEMRRLTATLNQTLRYGTPLAQAMRVLAAELRRDRMQRLEERAARLPALLVLPLILFIMPCLFVVLVGPSVIVLSRSLGG